MDVQEIAAELGRVRADFRRLVEGATEDELRAPSSGTRWTNRQLLFHMLFGYLLVRNLLPLVWLVSRLPSAVSRSFAALLNAGTRPFLVVNYIGSLGGGRVLGRAGMVRWMDRVTGSLERSLVRTSGESLGRGMSFPVGWDPYVYHYATQHYAHHRRQLTVTGATGSALA